MPKILPTDDLTLKLHTAADGRVWLLDGDGRPEDSGLSVVRFAKSSRAERGCRVRVAGLRSNVHLIMELYTGKLDGWVQSLEVCSPLVGSSGRRRGDPRSLLFDMRCWEERPSCGGWHEFTYFDYLTYRLVGPSLLSTDSAHAVECLRDHPLWRYLSVFPQVSPAPFAEVLAEILDPRFFVDRLRPDRQSKLESYMGLDPRGSESPDKSARAASLTACWKNGDPGPGAASTDPKWFFWKVWYRAAAKDRSTADLRTNQFFLSFVRQAWLETLYPDNPWREPLFVPEHVMAASVAAWHGRAMGRHKK